MKQQNFSYALFARALLVLCLAGSICALNLDGYESTYESNEQEERLSNEQLLDDFLEEKDTVDEEAFDSLTEEDEKETGESYSNEDAMEENDESGCIRYFKVDARTGNRAFAEQLFTPNPRLSITLSSNVRYSAELTGAKHRNSRIIRTISSSSFRPLLPACVSRSQIKSVYLEARGNDGWLVASITTFTAKSDRIYATLTSNPTLNKWVDYNEQWLYSYNARLVPLTIKQDRSLCITSLKISAMTGNLPWSEFYMIGKTHRIALILRKGVVVRSNIYNRAYRNRAYTSTVSFSSSSRCIKKEEILGVRLEAGGDDGWYIKSITTYIRVGTGSYTKLTSDTTFDLWLDGNQASLYKYDATKLPLTLLHEHTPSCGYGVAVCKCRSTATTCIFNLEIDEVRTFTSYEKSTLGEGISVRDLPGVVYHIDDKGVEKPLSQFVAQGTMFKPCIEFDPAKCSDPQYVDGKTYRMALAVNGQIPGPTFIVHEGQNLVIHVHNNLTAEGLSVHWHGIHQKDTPWMDGVGLLTQCPVGPSSKYTYIYTASPSGTFWYHSHTGSQRIDGFFGGLVVMERPDKLKKVQTELSKFGVGSFNDVPEEHTLTLLDWGNEPAVDHDTQLAAGLFFYPGWPIGEIPPDDANSPYQFTQSYESSIIGPTPYFSGLINGKGRHRTVPYVKTRLSIFTVTHGERFRFRLIGAQGVYAYRFSIAGHKLTVVATDGYWTQPVKGVDYIILHSGERYDFILEANAAFGNYWMVAETMEANLTSNNGVPPFESLDNVAEGILQYKRKGQVAPAILSTQYKAIKDNSPKRKCTSQNKCVAVNCPFKDFHPSYHIHCINVHELKLLHPTPASELPKAYPSKTCKNCLHFLNFNFEGTSGSASVNGRNFLLPPVPPQTQYDDFVKQGTVCDLNQDCNPHVQGCYCSHIIDVPYQQTVQLVLTSLGFVNDTHPIHLHGHTFHVVKVGYPDYDSKTGFIDAHNKDIKCNDKCDPNVGIDCRHCTVPGWSTPSGPTLSINDRTIRKDTVIVPAGGYVVINFVSDNPGFWFIHCHIEHHALEGMGVVVNEAFEEHQKFPIPKGLNQCGNFDLTVSGYSGLTKDARATLPSQYTVA